MSKKMQLDNMELAKVAGGAELPYPNLQHGISDGAEFLQQMMNHPCSPIYDSSIPNPFDSIAKKNPCNGLLWPYNQNLQIKYAIA